MFAKQRWHSTWHLSPGCLLPPSWEGCWGEGSQGLWKWPACTHPTKIGVPMNHQTYVLG